MEKVKLQIVKINEPSNTLDCLVCFPDTRPWYIDFKSPILESVFQGGDIFHCLCELRKALEKIGWYILCNGSRINTWASTMSRQMNGGFKIYILTIGEEMDRKNLVYIFHETGLEEVGTVDQQFDFYKRWLRSVGRGY